MNSKIVIFGDAGVGKTTLVTKLISNIYITSYIPTLNCEISEFNVGNNKIFLYDMSGMRKFDADIEIYSHSYIGIAMFSSLQTLQNLFIYSHIEKFHARNPDKLLILVRNKKTNENIETKIFPLIEQIKSYHENTKYIEICPKSGENIDELISLF